MGKSYFVPRNVKGETRLLAVFSVKSFAFTAVFGLIGGGISLLAILIIPKLTKKKRKEEEKNEPLY